MNYFNTSIFGQIESCGCFGELIRFTPLGALIKSAVLWIIALLCVITNNKN